MPEAEALLLVERLGSWARLTIHRPRVSNAANLALWERLAREVSRLAEDPGVAAIVVTGSGDRAFMAGADLTEFPAILADAAQLDRYLDAVAEALDMLERVPVPVIAAINGAAMGGGLELAIACDYRLAVNTARMGIPAADLGLAIACADVERIVALLGTGRARELLIFGRIYDAAEALAIGLVNEVVPPEELEARSRQLAEDVAGKAPLSVRSAKAVLESVVHQRRGAGDALYEEALRSVAAAWTSDELKQRVNRFLNRSKGRHH